MYLTLLASATATNSPPTLASDGVSLATSAIRGDRGLCLVQSTAGSGTMTVTIRLWGYSAVPAAWAPLGYGADATKGVINDGAALGETGTNLIQHAELIDGLENFDRLYAEITAIGGTSTAISCYLAARI